MHPKESYMLISTNYVPTYDSNCEDIFIKNLWARRDTTHHMNVLYKSHILLQMPVPCSNYLKKHDIQVLGDEVVADCKYVDREICRAPIFAVNTNLKEVAIGGQPVTEFEIGEHFLRYGKAYLKMHQ